MERPQGYSTRTDSSSSSYTGTGLNRNAPSEPCSSHSVSFCATDDITDDKSLIDSVFSKQIGSLSKEQLSMIAQQFKKANSADEFLKLILGQDIITFEDMKNPMYGEIGRSINDDFRNCFKILIHAQRCLAEYVNRNPIHPHTVIDSDEILRNSLLIATKYIQTGVNYEEVRRIQQRTEAQCRTFIINGKPNSRPNDPSIVMKSMKDTTNGSHNELQITTQGSRRDIEEISSTIHSSPSRDFEEITTPHSTRLNSKITSSSADQVEDDRMETCSSFSSRKDESRKLPESRKWIKENESRVFDESAMDVMTSELEPTFVKTKSSIATSLEGKELFYSETKNNDPAKGTKRTTEDKKRCEVQDNYTTVPRNCSSSTGNNVSSEIIWSAGIIETNHVTDDQQNMNEVNDRTSETLVLPQPNDHEARIKSVVLEVVEAIIFEICSNDASFPINTSNEVENSSETIQNETLLNETSESDQIEEIVQADVTSSSSTAPTVIQRRSNRKQTQNKWMALDEKQREVNKSDTSNFSRRSVSRRKRDRSKKNKSVDGRDDGSAVESLVEKSKNDAPSADLMEESSPTSSSHPTPSEPFIVNPDLYKKPNSESGLPASSSESHTSLTTKPKRIRSRKRKENESKANGPEKKSRQEVVQSEILHHPAVVSDSQYMPPQASNQFDPTIYSYPQQSTAVQFTGAHPLHCDTYGINGFGQHSSTNIHYQTHQDYSITSNHTNTDFPFQEYLNTPGYNIAYQDQPYSNLLNNL